MKVFDYTSMLHPDLHARTARFKNKLVLRSSSLKRRPGIAQRRRRLVKIRFKHTLIWQQKVVRRLAIYEDMKLKAMASHVEVVSRHIETATAEPNEVFIVTLPETDTNSGTLTIRQPKARESAVQSIIADIEERSERVWHLPQH